MKRIYILFIFVTTTLLGQSIEGNLSKLIHKKIKLEGFNGFQSYLISEISTDGNGNFKRSSSFGRPYSNSRNITLNDIDNDGDIDILITNRVESNEICLNDGKGNFEKVINSISCEFGFPSFPLFLVIVLIILFLLIDFIAFECDW
jgi:hypothetical protein